MLSNCNGTQKTKTKKQGKKKEINLPRRCEELSTTNICVDDDDDVDGTKRKTRKAASLVHMHCTVSTIARHAGCPAMQCSDWPSSSYQSPSVVLTPPPPAQNFAH